jgi:signal transduction histidine kinase
MSPIDVRILLDQVIRFLGYQARKQKVVIHKTYSSSMREIAGNHKQLKQVFVNIILNAIQSMPEGGELKVSVTKSPGHKQRVRISFADDGPGIPPEIQEHIFEPFYTTREGGTGLGLSFVDKVVGEHGGKVAIESENGKGTTVILDLPVGTDVYRQIPTADHKSVNK